MKPEAQRIAIAEFCGWTNPKPGDKGQLKPFELNQGPKGGWHFLPDFLNDLNAMHEAEKLLTERMLKHYVSALWLAMQNSPQAAVGTIHATAAQRAEALLRTIGKWVE